MDATQLTIGLAALFIGCAVAGAGVAWVLYGRFDSLKETLLAAIAASRQQGDDNLESLANKIDELGERQSAHELGAEKRFVTKDSAAGVYSRLEAAVGELRQDVRVMLSRLTNGRRQPPQG